MVAIIYIILLLGCAICMIFLILGLRSVFQFKKETGSYKVPGLDIFNNKAHTSSVLV
jgi:hypothetical protein